MKLSLYTDGGARGNPGPAAIGYVIYNQQGEKVAEEGRVIGTQTNNQAEYLGLLAGLKRCKDLHAVEVACYLDSELVVKQLRGEYKVKHEHLQPLWKQVREHYTYFRKLEFTHIPRIKNKLADSLVNKALDATAI